MTEEWEDCHEALAFEMSQAMPVVVLHEKYIHRVKPHDRRVKPGQTLWFHYGDVCIEVRVAAVTLDTISGRVKGIARWYGPERPTPTNDELPLGRRVSLKFAWRSRFFARLRRYA